MHTPYHEEKRARLLAGAVDAATRLQRGLALRRSMPWTGLPTRDQLTYWARQVDVRSMLADGNTAAAARLLDTIAGGAR